MKNLNHAILELINDGKIEEVNNIIINVKDSKEFAVVLVTLGSQVQNTAIISLYGTIVSTLKNNCGELRNKTISEKDKHIWDEVIISISKKIWKYRDLFEPKTWSEYIQFIYDFGLGSLGESKRDAESGLCSACNRLFSELLQDFVANAKEGDDPINFHIPLDRVEKLSDQIGSRWEACTYSNIIEDKIAELHK